MLNRNSLIVLLCARYLLLSERALLTTAYQPLSLLSPMTTKRLSSIQYQLSSSHSRNSNRLVPISSAMPIRSIASTSAPLCSSNRNFDVDGDEDFEIYIPEDRITTQFSRSSGPGGQNVNKVNTKAEIRFHVKTADWLPSEVRQRLVEQQANRINSEGELIITSQEQRSQGRNKAECFEKLREILREAYVEPKERKMWVELSEKGKSVRRHDKKKRSDIKSSRRKNFDD